MISDEQASAQMRKLASGNDIESNHYSADILLCELLETLGYTKTVEAFQSFEKWYA